MKYSKRMTKYGTRDCCCGEKLQRNDISSVVLCLLHITLHCLISNSLTTLTRNQRVECWRLVAYFSFLNYAHGVYFRKIFIRSFHNLSYDRPIASSKESSHRSAIHCFLFQLPVSFRFLKFIQYLLTSSSSSSRSIH